MEQILVYADSLSWGIIPNTRQRLAFDKRWPGVLENTLIAAGQNVRVIENCLNGRRTAWSDPFKAGRDGSQDLPQVIEMHSPLKLVVLMLGCNDFQSMHQNDAWLSAQGTARLVQIVRQSPIEPGMPIPQIMIVAGPVIKPAKGPFVRKFQGAHERGKGLGKELEKVARDLQTWFFDAASVIETSNLDGIHLDQPQHQVLGEKLARFYLDQSKLD